LAQGEIGRLQIKLAIINPLSVIQQMYESMTPLIVKNKQSLILDIPSSLPQIMADKDRLQQILFNLIDNASKYNMENEKIILSVTARNNHLVFSIRDSGKGIPEEDKINIFDPYTRLESNKRSTLGMGLGLAICKILVELHRGQIWVESEPNKGSTFSFTIPLSES
jgi:signal transduction histidine kinase